MKRRDKMHYLQRSVHGLIGEVEEEGLWGVVVIDDPDGAVIEQVGGVKTNRWLVHLVVVTEIVAMATIRKSINP